MSENQVTEFLLRRRSVVAKKMQAIAPSPEHVEVIINCAIRVPDHSNVQPWRIVIIEGDAKRRFDEEVILAAARENAQQSGQPLSDTLETLESGRMQRAGMVIAVLFKPVIEHKIPLWEQQLSCGAVCSHMLIAAQSFGYAAQWLTEWTAYDPNVITALGGDPSIDQVAGFIFIGKSETAPSERKRPVKDEIVSYWV